MAKHTPGPVSERATRQYLHYLKKQVEDCEVCRDWDEPCGACLDDRAALAKAEGATV